MITQEINKHKSAVWNGWQRPTTPQHYPVVAGKSRRWNTLTHVWEDDPTERDSMGRSRERNVYNMNEMSKIDFARYLGQQPFKKGDLVASKWAHAPYHVRGVYQITDIKEVHHFVNDWGSADSGPHILTLQPIKSTDHALVGGPGMYVPVTGDDIPAEWVEFLKDKELPDYGM